MAENNSKPLPLAVKVLAVCIGLPIALGGLYLSLMLFMAALPIMLPLLGIGLLLMGITKVLEIINKKGSNNG